METVNKYIEHTLLKADAKSEDIEGLIKEAIENKFFILSKAILNF